MPAGVIESNRQLMEGSVLCYCGRGRTKEKRNKRRWWGGDLFRILCAIRHVPRARCEEVTLRPHVPHRLLPGDRCAEHGPQEYGAGCRQRSYRGATGPGAYRIKHVDTERDNPIKSVFYRFTQINTTSPMAHSGYHPQLASGLQLRIISVNIKTENI